MHSEGKYWFRAKRYGWGWGLPSSWQGWVVLAVFVVSLIVGGIIFPPDTDRWSFTVLAIVLGGLLVDVCWIKGEPPRWRWGDDESA